VGNRSKTSILAGWEELLLRGYLLRQFALAVKPKAAVACFVNGVTLICS